MKILGGDRFWDARIDYRPSLPSIESTELILPEITVVKFHLYECSGTLYEKIGEIFCRPQVFDISTSC